MKENSERKFVADETGNITEEEMSEADKVRMEESKEHLYEFGEGSGREAHRKHWEEEAKLTPEERLVKKEGQDKDNRKNVVEWLSLGKTTNKHYSETLAIESGDQIGRHILPFSGVYTVEDLYSWAYKMEQEYPELKFSFERDPENHWIKYTVEKIDSTAE